MRDLSRNIQSCASDSNWPPRKDVISLDRDVACARTVISDLTLYLESEEREPRSKLLQNPIPDILKFVCHVPRSTGAQRTISHIYR